MVGYQRGDREEGSHQHRSSAEGRSGQRFRDDDNDCWDKPGAGVGETELNRLFYRLGWTKGWYKGDLRDKVFGQIANETRKPDWKMIKTKLTEMARKYDRAA